MTTGSDDDRLAGLLQEAIQRHSEQLGSLPWASEADRWDELVFCLVNSYRPDRSRDARLITYHLSGLGLTTPATLQELIDPTSHRAIAVRTALASLDLADAEERGLLKDLAEAADAIQSQHEGHVHRLLTFLAEQLRDQLVDTLGKGQGSEALSRGVTHWLQNTMSMPILLDSPALQQFRTEHGVNLGRLLAAAERVDLNIALLDDVARYEAAEPDRAAR